MQDSAAHLIADFIKGTGNGTPIGSDSITAYRADDEVVVAYFARKASQSLTSRFSLTCSGETFVTARQQSSAATACEIVSETSEVGNFRLPRSDLRGLDCFNHDAFVCANLNGTFTGDGPTFTTRRAAANYVSADYANPS